MTRTPGSKVLVVLLPTTRASSTSTTSTPCSTSGRVAILSRTQLILHMPEEFAFLVVWTSARSIVKLQMLTQSGRMYLLMVPGRHTPVVLYQFVLQPSGTKIELLTFLKRLSTTTTLRASL